MAQFFISRPILAWVFALFISIAGIIALPFLPIAQYPKVAPPQLTISTSYPGASPQEIYQGVTRLIEEELNGVANMMYFESTSTHQALSALMPPSRPAQTSIRHRLTCRTLSGAWSLVFRLRSPRRVSTLKKQHRAS